VRLQGLLPLFLALLLALPATLSQAQERRVTIVDYFQRLPAGALEETAERMWAFVQRMPGAVVDVPNGYIRCPGDGAQGDFELALFRYTDDRPLLALCQGEPGEKDYWYLHFYERDAEGRLHKVDRAILRPGNEPGRKFELPRQGRTIVVRDTKSGKVTGRWTWNGERFVAGK
jgi:hypothetical protein